MFEFFFFLASGLMGDEVNKKGTIDSRLSHKKKNPTAVCTRNKNVH